jgi:hypothetical protein
MTTTQEAFMNGFLEGIQSVTMPGRGLKSLQGEMRHRNFLRVRLVRNLSRSTLRASKSTSVRSSAK